MMNLMEFLIHLEGYEHTAYRDTAGNLTIGIGHKLTAEELNRKAVYIGEWIPYENGLSNIQIEQLFDRDISKYMAAVSDAVKVDILDRQYYALVSFAFNEGIGAFQNSHLLELINKEKYFEVRYEFLKWIWETVEIRGERKKRINKGLVMRRFREVTMYDFGRL